MQLKSIPRALLGRIDEYWYYVEVALDLCHFLLSPSILKLSAESALINLLAFFWKLQEEKIDSSLEFLILASDGLWDVVTNEVCFLVPISLCPFVW